jgi:hypothetical protein
MNNGVSFFSTKNSNIMKNLIAPTILIGLLALIFSNCETSLMDDFSTEDMEVELRSAQTTTQHFRIPLKGQVFEAPPPCVGLEPVEAISGYFNFVMHTTEDAGGGFHIMVHYNAQNVKHIGLSSGKIYVSNFNQQETSNLRAEGFPSTHSLIIRSQGAIKGEGQIFNLKWTVKMVFNAQGEAVVEIENIECDQ